MSINAQWPDVGVGFGATPEPHRGSSVEFAEYRRYQPGDDLRRMDWRAYGRTDRYHVKEFEADTNLRMMLVVDESGSMGFGKKLHAARQLASTLAYMAIGQGDAAGLICSSESGSALIPPRRIPGQVPLLLERLGALRAVGSTMLEKTLHELAETIRERAFVVVISDMLIEPSSLRGAVDHLVFRKHDVALFHLIDPRELQPDWDRPVRLEDLESDESMMVDPMKLRSGTKPRSANSWMSSSRSAARRRPTTIR